MLNNNLSSDSDSIGGEEFRALLRNPVPSGRKERFLAKIVGTMSEEEADAFERRIQWMNEQVEESDLA